MKLIENKSLILIEESPDTIYKDCNIVVTFPTDFDTDRIGRGSISHFEKDPYEDINSIRVEDTDVRYFSRLRFIFQYLNIEKKLLKLHRACDIDKNQCSSFIFQHFSEICFTEYKDVYDVWTLPNVNEEMWNNYKVFFPGKRPLPEQRLLKRAGDILNGKLKDLNTKLKLFHEEFKKVKHEA